ncbi:hypothetical protein IWQ60_001899 [Tieghemiomyces parasiticus]|uniref:Uncharacterized protein n=1 Tax=Tieghemiomyces parasiticus TaxID=78921 RepID=A0A9W8AC91_9FUNG|nr:hypothetical protein IWQ60_001899 [Tieghemiomyces parasiticus]
MLPVITVSQNLDNFRQLVRHAPGKPGDRGQVLLTMREVPWSDLLRLAEPEVRLLMGTYYQELMAHAKRTGNAVLPTTGDDAVNRLRQAAGNNANFGLIQSHRDPTEWVNYDRLESTPAAYDWATLNDIESGQLLREVSPLAYAARAGRTDLLATWVNRVADEILAERRNLEVFAGAFPASHLTVAYHHSLIVCSTRGRSSNLATSITSTVSTLLFGVIMPRVTGVLLTRHGIKAVVQFLNALDSDLMSQGRLATVRMLQVAGTEEQERVAHALVASDPNLGESMAQMCRSVAKKRVFSCGLKNGGLQETYRRALDQLEDDRGYVLYPYPDTVWPQGVRLLGDRLEFYVPQAVAHPIVA